MLKKVKTTVTGPTFLAVVLPAIIAWAVTAVSIATYTA